MTRPSLGRVLCRVVLAIVVLGGSANRSARAAPGSAAHRAIYVGFASGAIDVSIDAGLSWMPIGGPRLKEGDTLTSLAVDGGSGSILYAGAGSGIYRGSDASQSWSLILPDASTVATVPSVAGLAYAVLGSGNNDLVLARTTDGGGHWSRTAMPATGDYPDLYSIAVDPERTAALAVQGQHGGIVLSDDSGRTWRKLPSFSNLVWDPANADTAYARSDSGDLVRSADRGAHWRPLPFAGNGNTVLAAVPGPVTALLGTGYPPGTLYRADESHPKWQPVLQDTIGALAADPLTPGLVLASGESALYRSADGGAHWTTPRSTFSPYVSLNPVTSIAYGQRPASPSDPLPENLLRSPAPAFMPVSATLYGGLVGGGDLSTVLVQAGVAPAVDCGSPSTDSVTSLVVDPRHASTLYAGTTSALYISTDDCKSWSQVPGAPSGSISALAIDPASGALFAAVLPDHLWVSVDRAHWQRHTLPIRTPITSLAVPSGVPATLLVGTMAGVFASRDDGTTWLGVPQLHGGVYALTVDPTAPYAAWAVGAEVAHTTDAGKSWQTFSLPPSTDTTYVAVAPAEVPSHPLLGYTAVAANGRGTVLVSTGEDIYRSPDRGHTWTQVLDGGAIGNCRDGCPPISALGFDPTNPAYALAFDASSGYDDSYDEGITWAYDAGSGGGSGFIDSLAASPHAPLPVDPVAPPAAPAPGTRYVPATHHIIGAPFLSFYDRNGGPRLFGLPLTEAYTEDGQTVQVFERARLVAGAGGVTISPLGSWLTIGQSFPTTNPANDAPPGSYFAQTRQAVAARFWPFYQAHHGARILGAPISGLAPVRATDGSGHTYLSQWFENGRLEYHPELAGTSYAVSLGLVGVEFLRQRNWL